MKIDPYNFELYRLKVGTFFETQCTTTTCLQDGPRQLSCDRYKRQHVLRHCITDYRQITGYYVTDKLLN